MNDKPFVDLYSEDMQHGQEIEDRLKILNPFFPNVLKNI